MFAMSRLYRDISRLKNIENFKSGALNYIFEGELNARGKAVGFHYEGIPSQKGSIITGTVTTPNSHGVYEAMIEVNGIIKSGKSSFFPKDYSPQEIINAINEAYGNKQLISGNKFSGISAEGIEIQMYIDSFGNIISAFPIY